MASRSSLRSRVMLWLGAYAMLLSLVVLLNGYIVNERAEQLVWQSLLGTELDHFIERRNADPDHQWRDTENLKLYRAGSPDGVPASLRGLTPGVHDDVKIGDREWVVLVRDHTGERFVLTLDITQLETRETTLASWMVASTVAVVVVLGLLIAWGVGRVFRPLSELATSIGNLQPDLKGQQVSVTDNASSELLVIAEALNDYLQRNQRFVERERAFIDITSHELRTPIAVITGATELALDHPGLPPSTHSQLQRIRRTARNVEQLVALLLMLAKDPARLSSISDQVALDQLLPEIVEDHRHLTRDKDLSLVLGAVPPCDIVAPLSIVQAAIGNLLRNAIENSDRGDIHVRLLADATVVIEDPGHGMSPEEISEIYARVARGGGRDGGGIGLDLIARLCEHLGWGLSFSSDVQHGTTTTLRLSRQDP